jgi:UDP-N-acetylglucosamine--N-acetylmuramyl-(pentapeptide) pyrophosphoryl-undecaprenol N-acetylglucosamine transferase
VQAARVERAKVIAINLDASPGKANRWIASRAHVRLSTTRDAGPMWTTIPPIVRRDALAPGGVGACRRHLALREDVRTLLVTGGSLGAESLNAFLAAFVESDRGAKALRGWQILHQTGPKMTEDLRAAYARAGVVARVDSYLDTMGSAWGAADLCVCRAGAGNVSESWANRVPCLFMPYPYHKDAHQELNARRLGEGGRITKDHVDARANMNDAGAALEQLLTNEGARSAMRAALAALGPADGSQQASRAVLAVLSGESR